MRRLLTALILLLGLNSPALAGVPCSVPFNLTNGTTADATQVMANYNALITCLTNAAAAGANADITSLLALTTPLPPASGGATTFVGGVSTGTANAQLVATTSPNSFVLTGGYSVRFIAGFTNTGATQLNVHGTGLVNVFRRTNLGIGALVGGEILLGSPVEAMFDGTQFIILNGPIDQVGQIMDIAATSPPLGWIVADGSCISQANNAALFTLIGTAWGSCGVGLFALPDLRGRMTAGYDTQGLNGAASRLTSAGSGCAATTVAVGCGGQNGVIAKVNLPLYNLTITDPGHTHTGAPSFVPGGFNNTLGSFAIGPAISTGSSTTGITVSTGGSGTAFPVLSPIQTVLKIVKL